MRNRVVHYLITAVMVISLFITTLISFNHVQAAGASVADLISEYSDFTKIPVYVDGTEYWIMGLYKRIDPATLEATTVAGETKVYVDTSGNPVSDPAIARKIGTIDFARHLHYEGFAVTSSQLATQQINQRLQLHGTIRWLTFAEDQLAWGIAEACRTYATRGILLKKDLINKAKSIALDMLADPKLVLEPFAYMDMYDAREEYQEWLYQDEHTTIDNYATAEVWCRHLFAAEILWDRGRDLLDEVDEIDKTLVEEVADFFGKIVLDICGDDGQILEALMDYIDIVENISPSVGEYLVRVESFDTELALRLAKIGDGAHTQYTLALAKRIQEKIPDLTLPSPIQISPTSAEAGDMISITYTIKNIGTAPSGYSTNRISLDSSRQYGTSIYLKNSNMLPLDNGAFQTVTERVRIPSSVSPGTYYVTVYTDVFQVVDKTGQNNMNNIGSTTPLKLTIKPDATIDFSVSSIVAPSSATLGDTLSMSFTIQNSGNSASGPFTNRVFLGTSPSHTTFPLASIDIDSLASGKTCDRSVDVTIPTTIPTGNYYINVYADAYGDIQETNENNNIGNLPFAVGSSTIPQYTLTISVYGSGITTPGIGTHTYTSGTVVQITATAIGSGVFSNWVGDVGNPYSSITTVTMTSDKSVTASFWSTDDVVNIPDPILEGEIRNAINKPSGNLYKSDLAAVTQLYIAGYDFTSLTGLEYCTNLIDLGLLNDAIDDSDLTTISKLTNLRILVLYNNQITDGSALAGLTNLEELNLMYNQISDIHCLGDLTELQQLYLTDNLIEDISPLAGMNKLQELGLAYNQIKDISVLANFNGIRVLDLGGNWIDNILPLSNLTNLQYLTLYSNINIDLSVLSNLTNLNTLWLNNNNIKDISALASLTNIYSLGLSDNNIDDISVLANFGNLHWAYLENNQIKDISVLSNLAELELLELQNNQISDISGIAGLTNLDTLNLGNNLISDIYPLTLNLGLGSGDVIDISHNYINIDAGSQQATYIQSLESRGVWYFVYEPQNGPSYTLTMCALGNGNTSPLPGTYLYPSATVVDITATADVNWHFIEWSGDVEHISNVTANSTQITMNGNCAIAANFELDEDLPDLTIQANDIDYAWDGSAVNITVNIHNTGLQTVEDVITDIYAISEDGSAELIEQAPIESIAVGDVASIVSTWSSPPLFFDGGGWLGVITDSAHSVTELDETNNQVFIVVRDDDVPLFPWCFIATAAYGTPMAEEIQILRQFRDEYLLTNPLGQALVGLYYKASPPIAEFITEHPSLKPIMRTALVPAVAMSTVAINTTPAEKVAIAGLLVLVSVAVAIWSTRRRGRGPEYT
jgi:Leucine-rich repeat (LRR) protein